MSDAHVRHRRQGDPGGGPGAGALRQGRLPGSIASGGWYILEGWGSCQA